MKIVDVSAPEGYEVEETSYAKERAMDIVQEVIDHCFWLTDSEEPEDMRKMEGLDAISAADRIVETLIAMGWRPTR